MVGGMILVGELVPGLARGVLGGGLRRLVLAGCPPPRLWPVLLRWLLRAWILAKDFPQTEHFIVSCVVVLDYN